MSRRTLQVAVSDGSYPVELTADLPGSLLRDAVSDLHLRVGARRVLLVTDSNVGPLYAADAVAAVEAAGCTCAVAQIEAGEPTKTLATWAHIVDRALALRLGRDDLIVALGGGVVGDVAGFAAASVNRGIRYIQVPTTLLAQVDSSVGGKTGVNHAAGKNLVGAFWQPCAVVASQAVLATLPARQRRCGLAEAVKHGFIADASLVRWAVANASQLVALEAATTAELVARCVAIKAAVVAADEREAGQRAILNFGHTFGHAFELELGYGRLTHGEAIALGMVVAADLSVALKVAERPDLSQEVVAALKALELPHRPYDAQWPGLDALVGAARADKKAVGDDSVRFILLRQSGTPLIQVHLWEHIREALKPRFDNRRSS